MRQTRTLRLRDDAAEELASVAAEDGLSVSGLIAEALEDAVENGLDADVEPLPTGSRTVGAALDERLIRRVARAAAEEGLTFSGFARQALAGYLAGDDDEDDWPALFDPERRREVAAGAVASGLRRLGSARESKPEALPSPPAPARPRPDGTLVVVAGCLHVTSEQPDAGGHVLCSVCRRYAPIAPAGSIEHTHVLMREQLRRERVAAHD